MEHLSHPPVDPVEEERAIAVQQTALLDTLPEADFDHFTQLAAAICNAPISTITLIDHTRQFTKSSVGIPPLNGPREYSICNTAIQYAGGLEIEDLTCDKRFLSLPSVAGEPHLRFYAGYPLRDSSGHVLGMLSVSDTYPRRITQEQKMTLRVLAQQVVMEIELRKHAFTLSNALKEQEHRRDILTLAPHEVHDISEMDELTSLSNRRSLENLIHEAVRHSLRYDEPLAALMLDVDHFKQINEKYGEAAGDDVLRMLAVLLQQTVRETDIIARYEEDMFCLLLPMTDKNQAHILAERIRAGIALHPIEGRQLTVSIGVADMSYDPDSLLSRAEAATYLAKRSGRNCICSDSFAVRARTQKRLAG